MLSGIGKKQFVFIKTLALVRLVITKFNQNFIAIIEIFDLAHSAMPGMTYPKIELHLKNFDFRYDCDRSNKLH